MLHEDQEIWPHLLVHRPYWLAMNQYLKLEMTLLSGFDGSLTGMDLKFGLHLNNLLTEYIRVFQIV